MYTLSRARPPLYRTQPENSHVSKIEIALNVQLQQRTKYRLHVYEQARYNARHYMHYIMLSCFVFDKLYEIRPVNAAASSLPAYSVFDVESTK